MLRILFIGENWYGSNARSCAEGLRRMGHDVLDIDQQTFIPQVAKFSSRVVRRLLWFRMVEELNDDILNVSENLRPDIVIAFKGTYIFAQTLQALSRKGIALYNYFPDTSAFAYGKWLPKSLPEYDCIFYTKPFWYSDAIKRLKLKNGFFLPHGYDPVLHRRFEVDSRYVSECGCDVGFIAIHSKYKEGLLDELVTLRPKLNFSIWGEGWKNYCKSPGLQRCIRGYGLYGERYSKAIQVIKINLAIMNGPCMGASSVDLTTSRTYLIPASGGFMLHERNPEVLDLYKGGEEIECFDSAEELAEKIDYYLAHPAERARIAQAGYTRCVPAYSYDNRMAELLRWHHEHRGIGHSETASA